MESTWQEGRAMTAPERLRIEDLTEIIRKTAVEARA